jgi:hypothetical protein
VIELLQAAGVKVTAPANPLRGIAIDSVSLAMAKSPVVAEVVPDFGHACPHWWPGKSPTRV